MYSPLELEKIEFGSAFMGGYKKDDVDEVFIMLKKDYEELYKECVSNRDKIAMLDELVNKYKSMEDSLQSALILAQTSSEAVISAANEKAQNIIREAENRSAEIERDVNERLHDLQDKRNLLVRTMNLFVTRNISQLRTQIDILNGIIKGNADEEREISEG